VADQYNVGIAEVAMRYILQQDAVAAVIVGARNANHLDAHVSLFSFSLSDGDLGEIDAYLSRAPPPSSDVYDWERGNSQF